MTDAHAVASSDALPGASVRSAPTRHDNAALRALLTLPPIQTSTSTALTVPETPAPTHVTGDRELDAVLWLRDCIETAHPQLIDKALEAFGKIKTPANELEKRYTAHVSRESNGHFAAVLMTFGFADLEGLAKSTLQKKSRAEEAIFRFGNVEAVFKDTAPEAACKKTLRGLKRSKALGDFDASEARARFSGVPNLAPATLSDCLYAIAYWDQLYRLRAVLNDGFGDPAPAGDAHERFCFSMLATLPPRTRQESFAVFEHLQSEERMGWDDTPAILRNLIGGGWA
ncbi:hypothetical protein [Acidovorax sp. LjRoot117]|uniref:hypothetical protein n=1 Tax=Acidovorax sp. LjRoot117 TaxID=3342255 RepID=UPI003ED1093A